MSHHQSKNEQEGDLGWHEDAKKKNSKTTNSKAAEDLDERLVIVNWQEIYGKILQSATTGTTSLNHLCLACALQIDTELENQSFHTVQMILAWGPWRLIALQSVCRILTMCYSDIFSFTNGRTETVPPNPQKKKRWHDFAVLNRSFYPGCGLRCKRTKKKQELFL